MTPDEPLGVTPDYPLGITPEERQRLLDRLQEAEGSLDRAMRCIDVGKPQHAYWPVHDAHAEVRAVRLAMQEETP